MSDMIHEAIIVQDACNLTGVAHSLLRYCDRLRDGGAGTDDIRKDPGVILFVAKMADLCRIDCDWFKEPIKTSYDKLKEDGEQPKEK